MAANQRAKRRRSSDEVRELMLDAARELFAAKGFAGTRTREVAERAGVTEQLLFNHFHTKERLFVAAVLDPFADFASAYLEAWKGVSAADADPEEMLREYVAGLYRLVVEHRSMFLALGVEGFGAPLRAVLDRLETLAAEISDLHGFTFDPAIAVRMVFVSVTNLALHQHELLPGRSTDEIVDEITTTIVTGLVRRR